MQVRPAMTSCRRYPADPSHDSTIPTWTDSWQEAVILLLNSFRGTSSRLVRTPAEPLGGAGWHSTLARKNMYHSVVPISRRVSCGGASLNYSRARQGGRREEGLRTPNEGLDGDGAEAKARRPSRHASRQGAQGGAAASPGGAAPRRASRALRAAVAAAGPGCRPARLLPPSRPSSPRRS